MAWNPSFNFKLRDDEVVFGNLIFEKNTAQVVCVALAKIRDGYVVNNTILMDALKAGCHTNEELDKLHEDFEEVKKDITYFKSVLKGSFIKKAVNMLARVNATSSYITGSISWLQKYKELKECACELYMELKAEQYQFTQEELSIFEKRYSDVASCSTSQERRKNIVDTMMADSIANGEIEFGSNEMYMQRVQAEVACGLITEEQAKAKIESNQKLFAAIGKLTDFDSTGATSTTADTGNPVDDTNSIHPEPVKDIELIVITSDMLSAKLNAIHGSKRSIKEKLEAILKLYDCTKAGTEATNSILTDEFSAKCHNLSLSDEEFIHNYNIIRDIIIPSTGFYSGLFNSAGVKVDKDVWDNIWVEDTNPTNPTTPTEDTTPTTPKQVDEFIITNRMVYNKLHDIHELKEGLMISIACERILSAVAESCKNDGRLDLNLLNRTVTDIKTNKDISIADIYCYTSQIVTKLLDGTNEGIDKPSPIKTTKVVWDSITVFK